MNYQIANQDVAVAPVSGLIIDHHSLGWSHVPQVDILALEYNAFVFSIQISLLWEKTMARKNWLRSGLTMATGNNGDSCL